MKKSRMSLPAACALLLLAAPLAAQMDNLTNLSVEWMRMPARNAAVDSADIVVYNPAALVRLANGFHLNIGNQSLLRKPSHTYDLGLGGGERTFSQQGVDAFLPNLYAAYKSDKWAVYGGLYISGGGAVADYPDGSLTTDLISMMALANAGGAYAGVKDQYLKASSYYLTGTLGGAYALSGALSASLGLRYISAVNTTKMGLTLGDSPFSLPDLALAFHSKDKASGAGFVLGLHYAAGDTLDLAAHYESKVKLEFTTTVNQDDIGLAMDGAKSRRDLPAALYVGAGYRWTPKLQMLVDFNYWFQTAADWGTEEADGVEYKWADVAGDCWAAGIGLAYDLSPRLKASAGTVFTKFLFADKPLYYSRLGEFEAPKADNWNCGVGLAWKAAPGLTLNLALGGTFWQTKSIAEEFILPFAVEVKAHAYSLSVGANLDI